MEESKTVKVKRQIAALLAKARSAKEINSLAEAETFLMNANRLIEKYNISVADLSSLDSDSGIYQLRQEEYLEYYKTPEEGLWERSLFEVVSYFNFCRVLFYDENKKAILIGKKDNVLMVKDLIEITRPMFQNYAYSTFVKDQLEVKDQFRVLANNPKLALERMAERISSYFLDKGDISSFSKLEGKLEEEDLMPGSYREEDKYRSQFWYLKVKSYSKLLIFPSKSVYIRSFLYGAVDGLRLKYNKAREKSEDKEVITAIIINLEQKIEDYINKHFGGTKTYEENSEFNKDALQKGQAVGYNLSLDKQLQVELIKQLT